MTDYIPSQEVEMACLGSMLLDENAAESILATLNPEDFARPAHQIIYRAFQNLKKRGMPVSDFLALTEELRRNMQMETVGGEDYLLAVAEFVPSPANADYYAQAVKGFAVLRSIQAGAKELLRASLEPDAEIGELRDMASRIARVDSATPPVYVLSDITVTEIDRGVPTGYPSLDKSISTLGYPIGQMTVVAAYQKTGKTTFMLGSALSSIRDGKRVCYATFADLNKVRIKRRFNRAEYGVSNPIQPDPFAFETCVVYDGTRGEKWRTVEAFADWFRLAHRKRPFDVCFVDYAGKIETKCRAVGVYEQTKRVASVVSGLAEETGCPIVLGSQIQLAGKDGGPDKTKGGTSLEEEAGWVIRLKRKDVSHPKPQWYYCDFEVYLSRFGPQNVTVRAEFCEDRLTFREVA